MRTSNLITVGLAAVIAVGAGGLVSQHNQLVAQGEELTANRYQLAAEREHLRAQTERFQSRTEQGSAELPALVVAAPRFSE
jgi:uncharacterized protein HemX